MLLGLVLGVLFVTPFVLVYALFIRWCDRSGIQAFGATVLAPIFEEGFKGAGVLLIALASALGLKELEGPLDGAIYGGIVGLGFTLTEDTLYVANSFAASGFVGFVGLLQAITTYVSIGRTNLAVLLTRGWNAYRARRDEQLALVELAFVKSRRRRGERDAVLDAREARLRWVIADASQRGVWLGE